MTQLLLSNFAPMLFGAQLILTLVLVKGDICPGQRGRVHKMLPAIGILWLAVASLKIEAFMVVFAVFYFFSQVQTKKTRDEGPLWVMYLANGLAFAYVAIIVGEQSNWANSAGVIVSVFLLGASFAHVLLTIARTRLQAFHRILPVSGVMSAMLMALVVLAQSTTIDVEAAEAATQAILLSLGLLISGVIVWSTHMFSQKEVNKVQLSIALLLLLSSATIQTGISLNLM